MMSGGHFPEEPGLLNVFLQKNKIIKGAFGSLLPKHAGLNWMRVRLDTSIAREGGACYLSELFISNSKKCGTRRQTIPLVGDRQCGGESLPPVDRDLFRDQRKGYLNNFNE